MPASLQGRGIAIANPDWAAGMRLADYLLYDTTGRCGDYIRNGAILCLKDRSGKKPEKEVVYRIQGQETFVIGRDLMQ